MPFSPVDQLLHLVTARGAVAWPDWKSACQSLDLGDLSPASAARVLDELGHVEISAERGSVQISAAPAVLARLPCAGAPAAVLCGGRSPESERRLAQAAGAAAFTAASHSPGRPETPAVMRLEAADEAGLAAAAEAAGVAFDPVPTAWRLAHAAGSVANYAGRLAWRHGPEPNLPAREFQPVGGRFGAVRPGAPGLRLIRYFPRTRAPYFELREGERAAVADRDWGVYACLAAQESESLVHDRATGALAVPAGKPLPRPIGRALGLCSGEAPEIIDAPPAWPACATQRYWVYRSVPAAIAELVLSKLSQEALPFQIRRR